MTINLDKKIEKSIKQIADDVSTIRKKLVHLEDVNQKLDHIVRNLREDYYYALGRGLPAYVWGSLGTA